MKKIKIQMYIPDNDNHTGNTDEGTKKWVKKKQINIMADISNITFLAPKLFYTYF